MKKKVEVTFELSTIVEVDVPEEYGSLDGYVVTHKEEIMNEAKKKVLEEGIENRLTWDNLYWNYPDDEIDLTLSDIDFSL